MRKLGTERLAATAELDSAESRAVKGYDATDNGISRSAIGAPPSADEQQLPVRRRTTALAKSEVSPHQRGSAKPVDVSAKLNAEHDELTWLIADAVVASALSDHQPAVSVDTKKMDTLRLPGHNGCRASRLHRIAGFACSLKRGGALAELGAIKRPVAAWVRETREAAWAHATPREGGSVRKRLAYTVEMRDAIFYLPSGGRAPGPGEDPGGLVVDGLRAVEVVGDGSGPARSGLTRALELIAGGVAGVLVVAQLRDAASSLSELVGLLAWLQEAGADLVAVDVGFDSGEAGARQAVALLREVERWDREPHPARRPRGRPGLSSADPQLAQRLALLRERGLSLQAIAAALNSEGVPTPRGGVEWRPSSVQAALGYRRPRPPVPGAPPVPAPRPLRAGAQPAPGPGGPAPHHGIHAHHDPRVPRPPWDPGMQR